MNFSEYQEAALRTANNDLDVRGKLGDLYT
jgi:hypothetical protein